MSFISASQSFGFTLGGANQFNLRRPAVAGYADLNGIADTNTVSLSSALQVSHEGCALRCGAANQATTLTAGIYRDVSSDLADVGDKAVWMAEFGWRRVNYNANTTSANFYAAFGIGSRQTGGNSEFSGTGARYVAMTDATSQMIGVTAASNLGTLAGWGGNLSRQGNRVTGVIAAERTASATLQVTAWLCEQRGDPYYIGQRSMTTSTSPWLGYIMHVNNNGHDAQLVIYGECDLTWTELQARFGLVPP